MCGVGRVLQSKETAAEHHICSKWSHQQTDRLEPTHWGKPQGGGEGWTQEECGGSGWVLIWPSNKRMRRMRRMQLKRGRVEEDETRMTVRRSWARFTLSPDRRRWGRSVDGFAWNRKLESLAVFFLLLLHPPFSLLPWHPSSVSLPLSPSPSFSSARLTEQEMPVRVKMKGLWGRCMCVRVHEVNEWPLYPSSPL